VIVSRRHDDQPLDPPSDQPFNNFAFPVRVVGAAARKHIATVISGHVLHGTLNGGQERVRDIVEKKTDCERPSITPPKVRGSQVGPVTKLVDRPAHLCSESIRDRRVIIDDAGNGSEAHTGERCDIAHSGAPSWHSRRARIVHEGQHIVATEQVHLAAGASQWRLAELYLGAVTRRPATTRPRRLVAVLGFDAGNGDLSH
jgi:hypothetical protein